MTSDRHSSKHTGRNAKWRSRSVRRSTGACFRRRAFRLTVTAVCFVAIAVSQLAIVPTARLSEPQPNGLAGGCSYCRAECERTNADSRHESALAAGESDRRSWAVSADSNHDSPAPDPSHNRDCPVCRYVLISSQVLLPFPAEVTASSVCPDAGVDFPPPAVTRRSRWGVPPVRGPPIQTCDLLFQPLHFLL